MAWRYSTALQRSEAHARLTRLARVLDSAFRVPGTQFRIGWDGLIGLIPIVGDVVMALIALYIVVEAWRLRTPIGKLLLMVGVILGDLVVGEIPVAGDLADFFYKANRVNLRILGVNTPPATPRVDAARLIE